VSFACPEQASVAERVQVGIAKGDCPAAGEPLYRETILRGSKSKTDAPGKMARGEYALFARALDGQGQILAEGCTAAYLPGSHQAEIELMPRAGCDGLGSEGAPRSCVMKDDDRDGTENCYDGCRKDPGKVDPGRCGCGAEDRSDDSTFRDAMGYPCSEWRGFDCARAAEKWGYTVSQELTLLESCPEACGVCE